MKGMNMNRMLGSLKRKRKDATPNPRAPEERDATLTIYRAANSNGDDASADSQLDTPEANAARSVVCLSSLSLYFSRSADYAKHLKHADAVQRLFCESGGPNGSVCSRLYDYHGQGVF
jgi:hypothetical protein